MANKYSKSNKYIQPNLKGKKKRNQKQPKKGKTWFLDSYTDFESKSQYIP